MNTKREAVTLIGKNTRPNDKVTALFFTNPSNCLVKLQSTLSFE